MEGVIEFILIAIIVTFFSLGKRIRQTNIAVNLTIGFIFMVVMCVLASLLANQWWVGLVIFVIMMLICASIVFRPPTAEEREQWRREK